MKDGHLFHDIPPDNHVVILRANGDPEDFERGKTRSGEGGIQCRPYVIATQLHKFFESGEWRDNDGEVLEKRLAGAFLYAELQELQALEEVLLLVSDIGHDVVDNRHAREIKDLGICEVFWGFWSYTN